MKKYFVTFLLLVLFSLISCNKNDNPTSPTNNPTESPDIKVSDFLTTPSGGDPRGTYAPNSPFIDFIENPSQSGTIKYNLKSISGSGTITFSGSSASSGNLYC